MKAKKDIINHTHSAIGLLKLSDQMTEMIKKLLGQNGLIEIDLIKNWDEIAGFELAQNSLPERIDFKKGERGNGTLFLSVSSGAFALEISHKSQIIIEKINTYFGYLAVSNIKIIQKPELFSNKTGMNIADIKQKILVSEDEKKYIEAVSEGIENQALKERLESIALLMLQKQKKEN